MEFCTKCYNVAEPKKENKGSIGIELLIWLPVFTGFIFLAPFCFIYSLWRFTNKVKKCPKCGSQELIPADCPLAKSIINQSNNEQI